YNLKLPDTWDDVYDLIAVIQKRYLEFAPPSYETLLYQNGGTIYNDNGKTTALDTEVAIESFIQWTDLYTSYKLPVESNFANRFRFAEMPFGLQTYDFYNQISVFAPEIKGLWSFTNVPGTKKEDGTVDRSVIASAVSSVIMAAAKDKEASWEYLKWWTGAQAQIDYGREVESILGTAARYTTANTEALQRMPWRSDELAVLMDQRNYVVGYPQVPGSYALTRNLNFAFLNVVNNHADPRETLLDYVKAINDELRYKREELGFPVD
ncbi:MAG: ABC transporter substrate-binding protein, partial [Clostridia bacterium]|nr:ABC transporter substrate-binding protein [Clostridia bacterium]